MCISVFAPRRSIRIVYGSESVWLSAPKGLLEICADLLIQNTSDTEIPELLCIVPQKMFSADGAEIEPLNFEDITDDMINARSRFMTGEEAYARQPARVHGEAPTLGLTIVNPTKPDEEIPYVGTFVPGNRMSSFAKTPEQRLILNLRLASALRIELAVPLKPEETRWFRWHFRPQSGPKEMRTGRGLVLSYLCNDLSLTYQISGPRKVRFDIRNNLAAFAREVLLGQVPTECQPQMMKDVQFLQRELVEEAACHPETHVVIDDWRSRFFQGALEVFDSISMNGAVRIVGDQPNYINRSIPEAYYEWATGRLQVSPLLEGQEHGAFSVRFRTRYVPPVYHFLPAIAVISLVLAIIAIIIGL